MKSGGRGGLRHSGRDSVPAPDVTQASLTSSDMEIVFDTRVRKYIQIALTKHEPSTETNGSQDGSNIVLT